MYLFSQPGKARGLFHLARGFFKLVNGIRFDDPVRTFLGGFGICRAVIMLGIDQHLVDRFREEGGASLLADRHEIGPYLSDEALAQYRQPGTLGYLIALEKKRGLDLKFYEQYLGAVHECPKSDTDVLFRRATQHHDLFHVITGYPTTVHGEIAIFMFNASQNGAYSSLFVSLAISVAALLMNPRGLPTVLRVAFEAWLAGQRVRPLHFQRFEHHLSRDLNEVRALLGIPRDGLWTGATADEVETQGAQASTA